MSLKLTVPLIVTISFLANLGLAVEKIESHRLNLLTSIYAIERPVGGDTDFSVMSTTDGRVYKVEASNAPALSILSLAKSTSRSVELNLNPSNPDFIVSASLLDASREDAFTLLNSETKENKLGPKDYSATVLDSKHEASQLFDSVYSYATGYDVDDHCYDRAHYWGRMFYADKKVNSMKVFLFFTPKYQRDHKFKWWFHVAPFVYVGDTNNEIVIDPTFETEVMTMHAWSLDFAEKAKKCEDGDSMRDYNRMGQSEDCVLIRASMYHYTPTDLEQNPSVTSWRCGDLQRVARGIPAPFKKASWKDVPGFFPANCR